MEEVQPIDLPRSFDQEYCVVIAHAKEIVRLGLERIFAEIPLVRRVHSCSSLEAARALSGNSVAEAPESHVVVTVVAEALVADRSGHPAVKLPSESKTLLLLDSIREQSGMSLSNSWADGYLEEESLSHITLCDALGQLERGQFPMPSGMTRSLLAELRKVHDGEQSSPHLLTRREIETLDLIAQGRSNKQIARQLGIGINGVKRHVSNLLAKLNCPNRTQAAAYAVRTGLISPVDNNGC